MSFRVRKWKIWKRSPSELAKHVNESFMRIKAIDHVQLAMPVGKEAEARDFYEGILGIPEIPKPANLAKRGGCWFARGELKVHLGVENDFRPARKAHPAFLVEDLAGLKACFAAAGYIVRTDEPLEGYERVYVDDPFGNRLEFMEPVS
jgi:catechol 2,3-dioxygenase-like lactoylglutathione lyase family enzyme